MPPSILSALALLVTLLRGKGFAASQRATLAVQVLCQAGLAKPSLGILSLTPQGEDIARALEARRIPALNVKRQEAYQRWSRLDREGYLLQEVRQALAAFEWYDYCILSRQHM